MTTERRMRVESLFGRFLERERKLVRDVSRFEEDLRYATSSVKAVEQGKIIFTTTAQADDFDINGVYYSIMCWEEELPVVRRQYLEAQRGRMVAAKLLRS